MLFPLQATRMELLRRKRRLSLAQRGHKLLKDKEEELMRHLLSLAKRVREKRKELEKKLSEAKAHFYIASLYENPLFSETAFLIPSFRVDLKTSSRRVLNLFLPEMEAEVKEIGRNYGLFQTSGELEEGIERFKKLLPVLLSLAAEEKALKLLLRELTKTRRRVNALEYILIPSLTNSIKFITFKLAEREREDLVRLKRIKR
jgi:V/A-type H+-transporting ATPase subunit D|uniref:V-type ATP synthase subunit D n=1 Tax=candidate division WOR-3 bacterium TaxID=2052148 RepID=A0A7C3YVF5_UNCW3